MQMERRPAAPRASKDYSWYNDLSRGCMAKRELQRERAVVGATYKDYTKSSLPSAAKATRRLFSVPRYRRELPRYMLQSQMRVASHSTNRIPARGHSGMATHAFRDQNATRRRIPTPAFHYPTAMD